MQLGSLDVDAELRPHWEPSFGCPYRYFHNLLPAGSWWDLPEADPVKASQTFVVQTDTAPIPPDVVAARDRLKASRDRLVAGLRAIDRVQCPHPDGAMYAFFRIDGLTDSLALCKRLVVEAGVGLAPGAAFGPEAEGYVRWCFATSVDRIDAGLDRFRRGLGAGA